MSRMISLEPSISLDILAKHDEYADEEYECVKGGMVDGASHRDGAAARCCQFDGESLSWRMTLIQRRFDDETVQVVRWCLKSE